MQDMAILDPAATGRFAPTFPERRSWVHVSVACLLSLPRRTAASSEILWRGGKDHALDGDAIFQVYGTEGADGGAMSHSHRLHGEEGIGVNR